MGYNRLNYLQKVIEIQNIVLREQKIGLLNQNEVYIRYIEPKYHISERTFYSYLGCNAKKELADIQKRENNDVEKLQEKAYSLVVEQNKSLKDAAKILNITHSKMRKIAYAGDFRKIKRLDAVHKRAFARENKVKKEIDKLRYILSVQKVENKYKGKYKSIHQFHLQVIKPKFGITRQTYLRYMLIPAKERIKEVLEREKYRKQAARDRKKLENLRGL